MKNYFRSITVVLTFFINFLFNFLHPQSPKLLIQSGHSATFTGSVSPDGRTLVTAGYDRKILIWDLKSGRHFAPVFATQSITMDIKWDSDNEHFYTGDYVGGLLKWNSKTRKVEKRIQENDTGFFRLQFINERNELATICADSSIRLYDRELNRIRYKKINGAYGISMAYCKSNGGEILIVGCSDSTQHIFNANDLSEINVAPVGDLLLDISFNSKYSIVSYTTPGTVSAYSFPQGKEIGTYSVPYNFYNEDGKYHILSCSFSKPGFYRDSFLLVSGKENDLKFVHLTRSKNKLDEAVYDLPKKAGYVTQFIPVQNSTQIISIHQLVKMYLWELKTVLTLPDRFISKSEIEMNADMITTFSFSPDSTRILLGGSNIHEFSLKEGISIPRTPFGGKAFEQVYYLKDGKKIALIDGADQKCYEIYGDDMLKPVKSLCFSTEINTHIVSGKKKNIFIVHGGYTLLCLNEDDLKKKWCDSSLKSFNTVVSYLDESSDGEYLAVYGSNGTIYFYDTGSGKIFQKIKSGEYSPSSGFITKDKKYFYETPYSSNRFVKWNLKTGKMEKDFKVETEFEGIVISPDPEEKKVVCLANQNQIRIIDIDNGKELQRLPEEPSGIQAFDFTPDGKNILVLNGDYVFTLYSYPKFEKLFSFLSVRDRSVDLPFTDDNFYFGGKFMTKLFSIEDQGKIYPVDQYDLQYNRPEKILSKTPYGDTSLIELYKIAFEKRKNKYSKQMQGINQSERPTVAINNRESVPVILVQRDLKLSLSLKSKSLLSELMVRVNKVPIYGIKNLQLGKKNSMDTTLNLLLSHGDNLVEISVFDKEGRQSAIEILKVKRMMEDGFIPDIYIVAIGVSEYKMSGYNLRYAAKDAEDFTNAIGNDKGSFAHKHKLVLKNSEVDINCLKKIKDFLKNAKENDQVIIFMAGHGVLDKNLDYYFAVHDLDFNAPEKNGITIESIEKLFSEILPFKKLLIMDSCHSGELMKEDATVVKVSNEGEGAITFRSSGNGVGQNSRIKKTARLINKMFAELNTVSGATILTATAGSDFAMESSELKNGLFTYCFLNGLKTMEADLDRDKFIYLDEMIPFLRKKVSALSNGEQEPNTRYENEYLDFKIK